NTHIGTGDASTTGIAAGGVWITKGMIVGFISQQSNLVCRPNTTVKTYFQYKYIQTNIHCIVSIRIGQAITVFLKAMRKDAVQKEELIYKMFTRRSISGRTSDTRVNDHSNGKL